jgi:alkylation response protein AidB-like acyl-CoA dehydrogenase
VATDGAPLLVWKACWARDNADPRAAALSAMAFVFAGETAYAAAQHSLHIHGGYGFMAEYDIQLFYRRAKAWVTTFADPGRELHVVADRLFGLAQASAERDHGLNGLRRALRTGSEFAPRRRRSPPGT